MIIPEREPRETGRAYALRILKNNIARMELAPGSMISENELAQALGLSRTPIREALIELSKVGIVEIFPQKGSRISLIDDQLVEESFFMRETMECAVIQLASEQATPTDIGRLKANMVMQEAFLRTELAASTPDFLELDNEFHRLMFVIAKRPHAFDIIREFSIHFDRIRNMTVDFTKPARTVTQHQMILNAVIARNGDEAERLLRHHLNEFRALVPQMRRKYPDYFI